MRAPTIGLVLALIVIATPVSAQRRTATASDAEIVEQATLVVSGERVEIYKHGVAVSPAFLKLAEDAYRRLEALTGRTLDTATLGPKIRIYVSDAVRVSHLWRGYNHPSDPKGIVLLSARAYEDGLKTINATYVHEMAHLFTWRYHSHTLREGLARMPRDYHAPARVGHHRRGAPERVLFRQLPLREIADRRGRDGRFPATLRRPEDRRSARHALRREPPGTAAPRRVLRVVRLDPGERLDRAVLTS